MICSRDRRILLSLLLSLYKILVRPHLKYLVTLLQKRQTVTRENPASIYLNGAWLTKDAIRGQTERTWNLVSQRTKNSCRPCGSSQDEDRSLPKSVEVEKQMAMRGHSWKIYKQRCHLDIKKYFFTDRRGRPQK